MMIIIDTSSLIRFFTCIDLKKAAIVKELLENQNNIIYVPDVVFPELEYVLLGATYHSSRNKVLKSFKFLISQQNIQVSAEVCEAVAVYEKSSLDIADCIIIATAVTNNTSMNSFDKKLLSMLKAYQSKYQRRS